MSLLLEKKRLEVLSDILYLKNINDTNVDFNSVVPVNELIRFFQIATFNHSNEIELDHKTMQEKSNAFWVITKMKLY